MRREVDHTNSPVLYRLYTNFKAEYQKAYEQEINNDFIKSDHCPECGGLGFRWRKFGNNMDYQDQCYTCAELAEQERGAM